MRRRRASGCSRTGERWRARSCRFGRFPALGASSRPAARHKPVRGLGGRCAPRCRSNPCARRPRCLRRGLTDCSNGGPVKGLLVSLSNANGSASIPTSPISLSRPCACLPSTPDALDGGRLRKCLKQPRIRTRAVQAIARGGSARAPGRTWLAVSPTHLPCPNPRLPASGPATRRWPLSR